MIRDFATVRLAVVLSLGASIAGCRPGAETPAPAPASDYASEYSYYPSGEITFLDSAPANVTDAVGLSELTFTDLAGKTIPLQELAGKDGTVVVVTRGNTNPICPYCSTQTAHYIRDYEQFRSRGVEVVVIYPIAVASDKQSLDAFLTDARTRLGDPDRKVPFPVLFDVALSAVNQLGIKQDLSKPATYIVDASGEVRYAYVGAHLADRPSTVAVLKELERLGIGEAAAPDDSSANDRLRPDSPDAAADGGESSPGQ